VKATAKLGSERNRTIQDKQDEADNDLRILLGMMEGKRFIWRLLSGCKLYESPFNPNGSMQAQNIGRGDVGRELLTWMNEADPAAYPKLMLEMGKIDE
jgi:hypothetical protein